MEQYDYFYNINFRQVIAVIIVILYIAVLIAAFYLLWEFYICNNDNCKVFKKAEEKYPIGSKEYTLYIVENFYSDGIWSIPYIGATLISIIALFLLNIPINLTNFFILFFISFIVAYFLFIFLGHHFIREIINNISNYIRNNDQEGNIRNNNVNDSGITVESGQTVIDDTLPDNSSDFINNVCQTDNSVR